MHQARASVDEFERWDNIYKGRESEMHPNPWANLPPPPPHNPPPLLPFPRTLAGLCQRLALESPTLSDFTNDKADENLDEVFNPPTPPEDYVPPPSFDDLLPQSEDEIAAAYEELYGPAYSCVSVLGNDISVMDSKDKKVGGFGLGNHMAILNNH